MRSVVHIKAVEHAIVKSVLSNIGFIYPNAETVRKMVNRAVDEFRRSTMEEATIMVSDEKLSMERLLSRQTRPSKIRSDLDSQQEPGSSPLRRRSLYGQNRSEESV